MRYLDQSAIKAIQFTVRVPWSVRFFIIGGIRHGKVDYYVVGVKIPHTHNTKRPCNILE